MNKSYWRSDSKENSYRVPKSHRTIEILGASEVDKSWSPVLLGEDANVDSTMRLVRVGNLANAHVEVLKLRINMKKAEGKGSERCVFVFLVGNEVVGEEVDHLKLSDNFTKDARETTRLFVRY